MMLRPKLACCNFINDTFELRDFALEHGFDGVEWSFHIEDLPKNPSEESSLVKKISEISPLEVRYHCAFEETDLGNVDAIKAKEALKIFRQTCLLVSKLGGRTLTIHVGLGLTSTINLSWSRTIERLAQLVDFSHSLGFRLCLENLAWGWTSRPELFEKLIRKSGCWATLDIGHARVCPSVASQQYAPQDFAKPHPERFLCAHIYHEEEGNVHMPPSRVEDLEERLRFLRRLPLCDWWVLELREKRELLNTLKLVRQFIENSSLTYGQKYPIIPTI